MATKNMSHGGADGVDPDRFDEFQRIITALVPVFLLCVLSEAGVSYVRKQKRYRLNDTINSISCGLISELLGANWKWLGVVPYVWVHQNFALVQVPLDSWWAWILTLICVDLGYYCAHRVSHRCNLIWTGHSPHHSSEEFNFSTAMRQGCLESFFFWIAYIPLAFIFPPSLFFVHRQLNLAYNFFTHTKCIKTLPAPIEFIFNTPSHHRVHHARNPAYIDKNFGGVLVIWDRLFGTFTEESETPVFGLVHPLNSWNPLWAEFARLISLVKKVRSTRGLRNKFGIVFKPPGWVPPRQGSGPGHFYPIPPVSERDLERVFDAQVPQGRGRPLYVFVQFAATVIFNSFVLESINNRSNAKLFVLESRVSILLCALFTIFSLTNIGWLMECRQHSVYAEFARLAALVLLVAAYFPSVAIGPVSLFALVSALWLFVGFCY